MSLPNDGFQEAWKNFEQLLEQRLSFMKQNPNWIESYVKEMMDKALSGMQATSSHMAPYDVFETHASVITRVKLSKKTDPYMIRTYWTPNRLKIEGLPNQKQLLIPLPAACTYHGCRAKIRDGVLEIRMPKDKSRRKEREIYIQFE